MKKRTKLKVYSQTEKRVHRTFMDWTHGAFTPNEMRLMVRIARSHGFSVKLEEIEGACFATFEKEW